MNELPPETAGLRTHAGSYPFLVCDLWGVLHDGAKAFPAACDALARYREAGGRVVLLSNSPQPGERLGSALARRGIVSSLYDALVTSGDLARDRIAAEFSGCRLFHLGPARDRAAAAGLPVHYVERPESADLILATGLIKPTPEDHSALLQEAADRGIPMLCANPDRIVIHRGRREICAGAVADVHAALGGPVFRLGKPEPPAYAACRAILARFGGDVAGRRILTVGDSLETDIAGARRAGLQSLLIESGLHADEIAEVGLAAVLSRYGEWPDLRMQALRW